MAKRRRRPEPSCPRCGNEEDLREWLDGRVYCRSCLECPHGEAFDVCAKCVLQLHTLVTYEGPRIADLAVYLGEARREYGLGGHDLETWTYEERELLMSHLEWRASEDKSFGVCAPPPHHRFG